MRLIVVAAVAASLAAAAAPGFAADTPPEAQAGLDAVRGVLRAQKNVTFRKIKVNAAGDVCATVSSGGGDDTEVMWSKSTGRIWINEAADAQETILGMGGPNIVRSDARADVLAWRTCQKG